MFSYVGQKSLSNLSDRKQQDNKNKSVFVIDDAYIATNVDAIAALRPIGRCIAVFALPKERTIESIAERCSALGPVSRERVRFHFLLSSRALYRWISLLVLFS